MRAAMYYGPNDVRLEDVPEPDPGPGAVKVRSLHNGLCGTDLHQFYFGIMGPTPPPPSGTSGRPTRPWPASSGALGRANSRRGFGIRPSRSSWSAPTS